MGPQLGPGLPTRTPVGASAVSAGTAVRGDTLGWPLSITENKNFPLPRPAASGAVRMEAGLAQRSEHFTKFSHNSPGQRIR